MLKSAVLIFVLGISMVRLEAQDAIFGLNFSYNYQIPFGDLADKYSNNSNFGGHLIYKHNKNWTAELGGDFLFGSDYKDLNFLGSMVTDGFVIGNNLQPEVPQVEGRGGHFYGMIGKIFPLSKENLNSGLHAKLGLGYLFYNALVRSDPVTMPQISGNYLAGYNRLEAGISLNGYLGYTIFSKEGFINGSAGIQVTNTNTSYLNNWDYAKNESTEGKTFSNWLLGPKLTMTLILKRFTVTQTGKDGYFYN